MWRKLLVLLYLLAIIINFSEGKKKKAKSVTTVLDAKWEQTPLVLEIAEYLAEESPEVFWQFVDGISSMDIPLIELGSDKTMYDRALAEAGKLLSPAQLSLLKLAVSLHVYSPRVEMYHQMAQQRGLKCPAAVDVAGTVICSPEQLQVTVQQVKTKQDSRRVETYRLDHHYPGSENKSVVAVLYGEIGTPEFAEFHKRLRQLATLEPVDYVLRHFVKERPNRKLRLSGYGVELQLKSTEYKAEDDTKVKGAGGADSQEEDEDDEIEGFVISKLKQLYPDKREQLERFVQELAESSDQLAPLKVWQFQELSLQAAQRILSAPKEEVLHTFTHIAQNFPMQAFDTKLSDFYGFVIIFLAVLATGSVRAKSLVRTVVNSDFKAEMQKNQEKFAATLNLQPSDTALFLNGIFFDMDIVDIMTILDSLRQELRVLEGLHLSGISDKSTLSTLLGLDLSNAGGRDYAIDIRDSAVQWINDIELDKQYRRWSSSLMDLLRPTFPGMLRSVRKNLYNLVIIGDPAQRSVWPLVKLMESFYVHTAPLRLGLVFAVNSTATGQEDAGVALLNAYNYIAELKDPYQGLSFITDVYATVKTEGDRNVEVSDVVKLLKVRYHSADVEEILGPDTDYDTGRKLATDFVQRSGLRNLPQALINGIPLPEKSLNGEEFEEAVLTEIMSQTPTIQKAVYRGDLTDSNNVVDYLMDQPNVMPRLNERILNTEKSRYLDLVKVAAKLGESVTYVTSKHHTDGVQPLTYWLVADLSQPDHRELLSNALDQMKSSGRIRVSLIINSAPDADQAINKLVLAALQQDPSATTLDKILQDAEAVQLGDRHPAAYGLKVILSDVEKLLSNKNFALKINYSI
ncbi:UDP-glucose:glycoprotein glucosyltransferase 1 [Homalodisca vitripennis]|nr:UDP-glucose:glycoprotein glucosyltransferase 1 [Homalodisca vitripennis]